MITAEPLKIEKCANCGHEDLESTSIYLHPSQYEAIENARSVDLFGMQSPRDSHGMDRRGAGRSGSDDSESPDPGESDGDEPPGSVDSLNEKIFLFAFLDTLKLEGVRHGIVRQA